MNINLLAEKIGNILSFEKSILLFVYINDTKEKILAIIIDDNPFNSIHYNIEKKEFENTPPIEEKESLIKLFDENLDFLTKIKNGNGSVVGKYNKKESNK